jgi:UDP-2-acetamido-3-amino-2,3-dideoxy-glucuronate N-acetyltransferase
VKVRSEPIERHEPGGKTARTTATDVRGVAICRFPWIKDARGDLTFAEFGRDLPFRPQRHFMVFDVPSRQVRGQHAHKTCHQLLVCVRGSCGVLVDDGATRREFILDTPTVGLHVAPMVWGMQHKHSPDAVLLVFASERYDPADYIREYQDFRRRLEASPAA